MPDWDLRRLCELTYHGWRGSNIQISYKIKDQFIPVDTIRLVRGLQLYFFKQSKYSQLTCYNIFTFTMDEFT